MAKRILDLIADKRDGGEHAPQEIAQLVEGYTRGVIPDYQMSAWLMAVVLRGLTPSETVALTRAMVESGTTLDLSGIDGPLVDKHSTGGVGDKTSLIVVPVLAACGVKVAKMSGRGLGNTGGTLDKLESIAGFRVELTAEQILRQVQTVGACLCAQTADIVPADKKMYALRDASATVPSLPLVASSVMSKKIAAGAPTIVLDVKVGSGAFMRTAEEARELAYAMIDIGQDFGRRVVAVLSDMNAPLGVCVGNRLEVDEAVAVLKGDEGQDERLLRVAHTLASTALVACGHRSGMTDARLAVDRALRTGAAYEKFLEIVLAQGGDLDAPSGSPHEKVDVLAEFSGYIGGIDAEQIGIASMRLGAGRETKEDAVDPQAGIKLSTRLGDLVMKGQPMAAVYGRDPETAREIATDLSGAWTVVQDSREISDVIIETIGL